MKNLREELKVFTGTFHYYDHWGLQLTDGVMYLAERAEAHWLVDLVWSYQCREHIKKEPFQLYQLVVDKKEQKGTVTCSDGNDNILMSQEIQYTDFPLEKISLYLIDGILLLPSEY